ncbi:MAG: ABC transporter permease [Elusimicrobia bacterium]|nr:ABC transporter permease [Elusimicrobiota bacterium]
MIIAILAAVALLAPKIVPYEPTSQNIMERLQKPSLKHLLGTDELGRDVFSRLVYGARISLSVGFIAVGISVIIGVFFGALAGFYGRWIDSLIMRFVDIMFCFPSFFLILMIIAVLGPNIYNVMIIIGITSWPGIARLVRGEILSVKEREYVYAAKAIGASDLRIIFKHILPNALAPVLVAATLGIADAILVESGLSFLGLGVQPPMPSWGNILTSGKDYIESAWWLTLFPGLAILITILSYNLAGEGLREVIDPKL